MLSRILGIMTCTIAVVVGFYLWGAIKFGNFDPIPAIVLGGTCGILCGAIMASFPPQNRFPLIGACAMVVLWGIAASSWVKLFGPSGIDLPGIALVMFAYAAIGAFGGWGYKVGNSLFPPSSSD